MPLASSLFNILSAERRRLVLWTPVLLMLGIGWYFALPNEPRAYIGGQVVAALGGMLLISRRWRIRWVLAALLAVALGFAAAQWRTQAMQSPLIHEKLRYVQVEGVIKDIVVTEDGSKLVLDNPRIEGLAEEQTPRRVRVSFRKYDPEWRVGDRVRMNADLFPLPRPVLPGAYDFGRYLYFEGIGATGYAMRAPEVVARAELHPFSAWLDNLRHGIAEDLRTRLPGTVGAVAAAMSVGEQNAIPEEANEVMRDAGIYHVVSISGLHMALAAGIVFFTLRLLLTLYPPLALRLPVKKIAAVCALTSAAAYLMLAGAPVPAQRSFIMVAFVLLAVLFDRRGISLYALAWAASLILLLFPDALLGASFHMSFAATMAIVAFYERFGGLVYKPGNGVARALWLAFLGIAVTSLVATLATAPFVIHHFNRLSTWGILTNMAVVPLASFVIMPGVVLLFLLLPFGLEAPAYWLLKKGIEWMMWCAEFTAKLPHASILLPSLTQWGFLLAVLGLLWLCLWQTRLRLLGVPMLIIGLATTALYTPPDVLVGDEMRQVMVRLDDGRYALLKGTERAFTSEAWLKSLAQKDALTPKESGVQCDEALCHYLRNGRSFILVKQWEALSVACAKNPDVMAVWRYINPGDCDGPEIIDRRALETGGVHVLYFKPDGITLQKAADGIGQRPWVP